MDDSVYLNGKIVNATEALLPVGDRAVLFGDSAFETLRAYRGRPFRLEKHLARLEDACRVLRMTLPRTRAEIADAVLALLEANGLAGRRNGDARVRITVTGGPSAGPKGLERPGPAGIFILAVPFEGNPDRYYRDGITLVISGIKRNSSSPVSALKSGNYLDSLLARQEALDRGADDAVMLTTAGNLSEATSSNVFFVKDGEVRTPDVGCGFLPGVTRETVIELCGRMALPCVPVMEGPEALLSADEVFLTNSMAEIVPVKRVGDRVPCVACPGPLTGKLSTAYRELVERELGPAGRP